MRNLIQHDATRCDGCGICAAVCPEFVFELPTPKLPVKVAVPDRCLGCMSCEADCPRGAIRIQRLPPGMSAGEIPAPGQGIDAEKLYDLIIIGAGPAGLGAALRGRMLGLEIAVIERMPSLRRAQHPDGGLLQITPDLYRMYERRDGVYVEEFDLLFPRDMIRERLRSFIVMGPNGLATKRAAASFRGLLAMDKNQVVERLAVRAQEWGAVIACNTAAVGIVTNENTAVVELENGVCLTGKVVISAEGSTGQLAAAAGAPVNEFPVGWSYGALAQLPPMPRPTDEAGFMPGVLEGVAENIPFLTYWSSGPAVTDLCTGPVHKSKARKLTKPLSAYIAGPLPADSRIQHRLGGIPAAVPERPGDGCRIFIRRLPRSAVTHRLLAAGDAVATCGMFTTVAAVRSGDLAAQVAYAGLTTGDVSATGLASYDRLLFRLSILQGMRWFHKLLFEAPENLSRSDLDQLFRMLSRLSMTGTMSGGLKAAATLGQFYLRNLPDLMKHRKLAYYLHP